MTSGSTYVIGGAFGPKSRGGVVLVLAGSAGFPAGGACARTTRGVSSVGQLVDGAMETFMHNPYETEHGQLGEDITPEIMGVHIDSTTDLRIAHGHGIGWPLDRPKTVEVTQHLPCLFPQLGFELCH